MKKQKEFYVYVLEILSTREVFYVGKGTGSRWKEHRFRAKNCNRNYHVYNKINKLWREGDDYTSRIVFRTYNEDEAYFREMELIAIFGKENLSNTTDGGDGSSCKGHTEETKKKIGDKNRGRKMSDETKAQMSKTHTGTRLNQDEKDYLKQKMQESETKQAQWKRMSDRMKKKVKNIDTGEIFESVLMAANSVGEDSSNLSNAIRKNKPCGGSRFEYVDSYLGPSIPSKIKESSDGQIKKIKKPRKKVSDETRAKMSESRTGIRLTEEEKIVLRQQMKDSPTKQEQCKKLSNRISVPVRNVETGLEFKSMQDAGEHFDMTASSIRNSIKACRKCKGLTFEFINKEEYFKKLEESKALQKISSEI